MTLEIKDIQNKYIDMVNSNINNLLTKKAKAKESAKSDGKGGYFFKIEDSGKGIREVTLIHVDKNNVDKLCSPEIMNNLSHQAALSAILPGSSEAEKISCYKSASPEIQKEYELKAQDFLQNNQEQINLQVTQDLLIDKAVTPAIVNRAIANSFHTAQETQQIEDSALNTDSDHGYCTKSLTAPLYELKYYYGGFSFLPENAETAAHPHTFTEHLKKENPEQIHSSQSLLDDIKQFKPGSLIVIKGENAQGNGHMMMHNGNDEKGTPQFIGFNNDVKDFQFFKNRPATIIDIPSLIEKEAQNYQAKQLDNQQDKPQARNIQNTVSTPSGASINIQIIRQKLSGRSK